MRDRLCRAGIDICDSCRLAQFNDDDARIDVARAYHSCEAIDLSWNDTQLGRHVDLHGQFEGFVGLQMTPLPVAAR